MTSWEEMSFTSFKNKFRPVWLLTAALAVFSPAIMFAAPPANAGPVGNVMTEEIRPATPSVYIDLLYHKMTGKDPDFDAWAFDSDEYKKATEHDKPIVFTKVRNRLSDLYEDLDPSDYIVIRSMVNCAKAYSDLQETFFFEEFGPETFIEFPSTSDDRKYGIILNGIAKYGEIAMRQDKAHELLLELGHGGDAHVEIIVKPVAADGEKPFEYDGESYWLLMGDVAEFSIWSDRRVKSKVWSDKASWYKEENPLMDLYEIPKK